MATIVRCGVVLIGLVVAAAGVAAEKNTAVVPKDAVDALLTRLDNISRDRDMTTAKKAVVAAEAMEKFNQQYKGKPLTVRLKIQDVVPSAQGHYLTANRPDLEGVQFYTGKFQSNLSSAEVLSVTKDSVLAVTGMVSASSQTQPRFRSEILKPGNSLVFPVRANSSWQIGLDNVSYQLEAAPKTKPDASPASVAAGKTSGDNSPADKIKNEQLRSVDDVKLFFLKGIVPTQPKNGSSGTGTAGTPGPGQTTGSSTRPGYGTGSTPGSVPAKVKHNHVYSAAELIKKFGNPASRTSSAAAEQWVYKCKDGVVRVHFTQVGVGYTGTSTSKSETLRLEIKSVDSSSTPSGGGSRL